MALNLDRLPPWPEDDFAQYGPVRIDPVNRIQRLTGDFLHRNWLSIPHVFHHDEIDVTDAEQARIDWNRAHAPAKLSPLVPLIKAVVAAIDRYPVFGSSLIDDGKSLVTKDYRHVGVAVDTPNGLLVPVIADCDRKDLAALAAELATVSETARTRGLKMAEMAGGVITISSLGHIGGTAFTPIINAPQVAILGVTRVVERLRLTADGSVEARKMLPLSLSYDHRVINGAAAASFVTEIGRQLPGCFEQDAA